MFSVIAREFFENGADATVMSLVARAVSDEVRHAEICRLLATRYLGRDVAWPPPGPVPLPNHGTAPDGLRPTLHITDVRSKIAGWLPRILEASMLPWLTGAGADGYAGFPAHGVASSATTREVVKSTAREVILVGFEQLGVDTSSAHAWMQAHAA